ncbi:MAG: hypothetical protein RL020_655 [Pseudomonadota bacterium]|jgi:hypothetical protein
MYGFGQPLWLMESVIRSQDADQVLTAVCYVQAITEQMIVKLSIA